MKNPKIGDRVRIKETNVKGIITDISPSRGIDDYKLEYKINKVLNVRIKIDDCHHEPWLPQETLIRLIPKPKPVEPDYIYINLYEDGVFGEVYTNLLDMSKYQDIERANPLITRISTMVFKLIDVVKQKVK